MEEKINFNKNSNMKINSNIFGGLLNDNNNNNLMNFGTNSNSNNKSEIKKFELKAFVRNDSFSINASKKKDIFSILGSNGNTNNTKLNPNNIFNSNQQENNSLFNIFKNQPTNMNNNTMNLFENNDFNKNSNINKNSNDFEEFDNNINKNLVNLSSNSNKKFELISIFRNESFSINSFKKNDFLYSYSNEIQYPKYIKKVNFQNNAKTSIEYYWHEGNTLEYDKEMIEEIIIPNFSDGNQIKANEQEKVINISNKNQQNLENIFKSYKLKMYEPGKIIELKNDKIAIIAYDYPIVKIYETKSYTKILEIHIENLSYGFFSSDKIRDTIELDNYDLILLINSNLIRIYRFLNGQYFLFQIIQEEGLFIYNIRKLSNNRFIIFVDHSFKIYSFNLDKKEEKEFSYSLINEYILCSRNRRFKPRPTDIYQKNDNELIVINQFNNSKGSTRFTIDIDKYNIQKNEVEETIHEVFEDEFGFKKYIILKYKYLMIIFGTKLLIIDIIKFELIKIFQINDYNKLNNICLFGDNKYFSNIFNFKSLENDFFILQISDKNSYSFFKNNYYSIKFIEKDIKLELTGYSINKEINLHQLELSKKLYSYTFGDKFLIFY